MQLTGRAIPRRTVAGSVAAVVLALAGCGTAPEQPPSPAPAADPTAAATSAGGTGGSGSSATADPAPPSTSPPTASASASPSVSPSGSPANQQRTTTVVMNGDLLWHDDLWYGAHTDARRAGRTGADAYDFAPLLAGIRPVVSTADLAICHQEVPLAPEGGPYLSYPTFAAPPEVVEGIKQTGYDLCTTASNHSVDLGFAGLKRTIDRFERAGIVTTGTARTEKESRQTAMVTTDEGVRIAVVTAATHLNGLSLPEGKPWAVNMIDIDDLLDRARRARRQGADIVLVALHSGDEFVSTENADQRFLARRLTASPAVDLVYCHSAHVVQPWTKVNGEWVVYGLGNTVAQHETPDIRGYDGVTARFTFERRPNGRFRVAEAEYLPTMVTRRKPGHPARLLRISTALQGAEGSRREHLLNSRRRTRDVVRSLQPPGLTEG